MNGLLVIGIKFYQKYLSPLKGFRCAHLAQHGGVSCSQAVKLIIQKQGVFRGWASIKYRFDACKNASYEINEDKKKKGCHPLDACSCFPLPGFKFKGPSK